MKFNYQKMQSEGFDNKIKQAAEHHHPAYDEKAWEKMSKLLDEHLPTKKDENKRRGLIFFLFFLFIGGGGVLLTVNWNSSRNVKVVKSDSSVFSKENLMNKEPLKGNPTIEIQQSDFIKPVTDEFDLLKIQTKNVEIKQRKKSIAGINNISDYTMRGKKQSENFFINNIRGQLINQAVEDIADKNEIVKKDIKTYQSIAFNHLKADVKAFIKTDVSADSVNCNYKLSSNDSVTDNKTENTSIAAAKKIVNPDLPGFKKQGMKVNKKNFFHFSFSTAPDVSFTGSDNLGRVKILAGVGMGYTFKERFTISSGFYTVKKIYSASAAAYKPPAVFYNYYPYLEKVDADCKVYEIPLSVSLNLGQTNKGNWLISTGISSYLMKKETYSYYYKYSLSGPTVNKTWTLSDKNKHYFSVFTLSGGYRFKLNKAISVSIEPYAKIPLKGVGYGKVKLNSGGILFSIGIKPFGLK
jgi:hypothetical protein